jgi:hypothetical protein
MTTIAAAALAVARNFQFDGKTYKVRPLSYMDLARFSTHLEERALTALDRHAAQGVVSRKAAESAIFADIAAGEYEPGGSVFARGAKSEQGIRFLLELAIDVPAGSDESAADVSFRIFADADAFARATQVLVEVNADPGFQAHRRQLVAVGTNP